MCRSCFQDLERAFELRKQIIEAETQHFQLKASEVYTFDIVEIDDEPEKFKIETVEIDSEEEPELMVERGSEDVKPDESHLNWMTMFDNGSSAGSDINEDPATESDKESTGTDEYLNTEIVTLSKRKRHSERDMVRSKGAGDDNSKECPVCKKVFRYNCEMRLHFESVHDKTISYKCSQCPKRSSHKAVIRRHLISVHKNSNNKSGAQKNRNNKSKTRPKTMPKTMPKTNTSITNHKFRCKVVGCQKYFLTLQELKDHKPIHAGEKLKVKFWSEKLTKILNSNFRFSAL